MTTKTITGTYSAGYLLSSSFNVVHINASGSVGGFGLVTSAFASVQNYGHLEASNGADGVLLGSGGGSLVNSGSGYIRGGAAIVSSGAGAAGKAGGAGAYFTVYGDITDNVGHIVGGAGGAGVAGTTAGVGGVGGAGAEFHAGGYVRNDGQIRGGAGGAGGAGVFTNPYSPGIGGVGGVGLGMAAAGGVVNYSGDIYGGVGGRGGYGPGFAATAGKGGDGIDLAAGGYVDVYQGFVRGGTGGVGGATSSSGSSGYGGAGGVGISLGAAGTVVNSGAIYGGTGGVGGGTNGGETYGGSGGAGGTGVVLAAGGRLVNGGIIRGGAGGLGITGTKLFSAGGYGGLGVELANGGTVFNYGTITGGLAGAGPEYTMPGSGVSMTGTGAITNGASTDTHAFIGAGSTAAGGYGIVLGTGSQVTVTNFGTLSGFYSVEMLSKLDTLVVEAGSAFIGTARGYFSTLVLASGVGTVAAFGYDGSQISVSGSMAPTIFNDFFTLEIGSGASFTLAAGADVQVHSFGTDTLINAGTLTIASTLSVEGTLDVGGKLTGAKNSALTIDGGVANFTKGALLVGVPTVNVSGAAQVTMATNLKYAGHWKQSAGTLTIDHAKTLTFTGSGSSFSGLMTEAGKGIADILFTSTTAATDTLNGVTINALRVNAANTTFTVGSGGATITATASLDFDTTSSGITGASASDILTLNGGIFGDGSVGKGQMGLIINGNIVSQDLGTITSGIVIDTGTGEDINNNLIIANSTGGITINSTIVNNGQVIADAGTLTMNGAVSGTGSAQVSGGTVFAASTFNQAVTFTTTTGTLELAHGQAYTATVTGFSRGGGTSLDLNDIGFVSTGEATFSGTSTGGTLTVTDGTHTAKIALSGNYLTAAFVSASDSHGGTIIHVMPPPVAAPPILAASASHALINAMAAMGATHGPLDAGPPSSARAPSPYLLAPHTAVA